jgi:hypothetical protein
MAHLAPFSPRDRPLAKTLGSEIVSVTEPIFIEAK